MYKTELDKLTEQLKVEDKNRHLLELSVKEEKKNRVNVEQRLSGSLLELSEAKGHLEDTMKKNEEHKKTIEAQQQECWFRRKKRKSQ